jgi:hypothetical protein
MDAAKKSLYPSGLGSPYHSRPWMKDVGAAAPAGGSNLGIKGIIAGRFSVLKLIRNYWST